MIRSLPALLALVLLVGCADSDEAVTWPLLVYRDPSYIDDIRASAGPHGWGRGFAWDAFQDGSVNPDGTAYAVRTAFALYALLDADAIGPAEREIAEAWNACCWEGDFWWYSDRPDDAIYTPNASSMMAGVMQRMGYTEQADAAIRRLVETAEPGPVWTYSEVSGERVNDLIHHVYTLWGIEQYREHGGTVEIPWTAAEAAAAMVGRTDTGVQPAGGFAARYAFAACYAPDYVNPTDLEADPATPRDAAQQVWAATVC